MNLNRFFELAKEKGIAESQLQISKSSSVSIGLFHREIDTYKVTSSQSIIACGTYNGKFATANTQKLDKDTFEYLIEQIIRGATYVEKPNEVGIFPGSPKYKKGSVYSKALEETPISEKIALLKKVEEDIYKADPMVTDADSVRYEESSSESIFMNSFGLKLRQRSNYASIVAGAVLRDGEETKTYYDFFVGNDLSDFHEEEFVKGIVDGAKKKLGGKSCPSGKYPTILSQEVASSLTDYFLSAAIADDVQRHSSFLEGKLGQKVASSKVSIQEKPLTKNIYFSYFDSEGVACKNKDVIKNGTLVTYFYNRETAKKDGVESTGNAVWGANRMGTGYGNLFVKPGKKSFDELISDIKEGVYITEVAGLGTGMNPVSGDFSCQAEGFLIKDGKVDRPLSLITLSGNLLKMFRDCQGFGSDVKMTDSSISIASMRIKSMSIGGE